MAEHTFLKDTKGFRKAANGGYLVVHELPRSGIAEAFRNIRTKLIFSSPDKELKTILVTSSCPKEGKTFGTVSLGIVMANAGKRVLLVDADQRRPSLGKVFSLGSRADSIGLSSLIMKRVPPEDAIVKTVVENLSVLPAGPKPPNPSELLGSESMGELLERLRSDFDLVVLDTPPVLGLPDTLNLASKVDCCLLVIKHSKTSYKAVNRAREAIQMVKGQILGAILNMVKQPRFGYGYGYGYGGYHGYYHGYYYHSYGEEEEVKDLKEAETEKKEPRRRGLFRRRKG